MPWTSTPLLFLSMTAQGIRWQCPKVSVSETLRWESNHFQDKHLKYVISNLDSPCKQGTTKEFAIESKTLSNIRTLEVMDNAFHGEKVWKWDKLSGQEKFYVHKPVCCFFPWLEFTDDPNNLDWWNIALRVKYISNQADPSIFVYNTLFCNHNSHSNKTYHWI